VSAQAGYSAAARSAKDASGRIQLRRVDLHVIEGERGPKQPEMVCGKGGEGAEKSRRGGAVFYRC
jgi:hypothetical protein